MSGHFLGRCRVGVALFVLSFSWPSEGLRLPHSLHHRKWNELFSDLFWASLRGCFLVFLLLLLSMAGGFSKSLALPLIFKIWACDSDGHPNVMFWRNGLSRLQAFIIINSKFRLSPWRLGYSSDVSRMKDKFKEMKETKKVIWTWVSSFWVAQYLWFFCSSFWMVLQQRKCFLSFGPGR